MIRSQVSVYPVTKRLHSSHWIITTPFCWHHCTDVLHRRVSVNPVLDMPCLLKAPIHPRIFLHRWFIRCRSTFWQNLMDLPCEQSYQLCNASPSISIASVHPTLLGSLALDLVAISNCTDPVGLSDALISAITFPIHLWLFTMIWHFDSNLDILGMDWTTSIGSTNPTNIISQTC
jgi:hypothetical protein